jgi:hypothetical protein
MRHVGGMKYKKFMPATVAGICASLIIHLSTFAGNATSLQELAKDAVSDDPAIASAAAASLRAEGPAGLEALLTAHAALIREHDQSIANTPSPERRTAWLHLQKALDAVSAQHDCSASHLYWYTDLDQAKAVAKAARKPILSLRLLGRLDEEYSCANSRFFRTTLYSNAKVAGYLRDHFILHWKSVRPVPRITIDFGDGRKIERTITGNSIHYILDSDGRPVDALPGLYGPKSFLKGLATAEAAALKCAQLSSDERVQYLRNYHSEQLVSIQRDWRSDEMALAEGSSIQPASLKSTSKVIQPTAQEAAPITASKTVVERPMLASFQSADDATWTRIAALHAGDATLDDASISLIRSKNPTAIEAGRIALTKGIAENPLTAMLRNFQRSIAEDTVRNEYLLHSQIHEWFVNGSAPQDLDRLNSRVYAKLFLTPDSDPWLGLVPDNTFTGLDNSGLVRNTVGH